MKSHLRTLSFGVFVKHRGDHSLFADCNNLIPKAIERSLAERQLNFMICHLELLALVLSKSQPCVELTTDFLRLVSNFLEQGRAHFERARPCVELYAGIEEIPRFYFLISRNHCEISHFCAKNWNQQQMGILCKCRFGFADVWTWWLSEKKWGIRCICYLKTIFLILEDGFTRYRL